MWIKSKLLKKKWVGDMSKDFANSYNQLSWSYAVAEYERIKKWVQNENTPLYGYAVERMKKLESKYPQLVNNKV